MEARLCLHCGQSASNPVLADFCCQECAAMYRILARSLLVSLHGESPRVARAGIPCPRIEKDLSERRC